jgi:hypothetical protein
VNEARILNEQRICHTPERLSYLIKFKGSFPFEWKMSTNNNEGFFSRFFAIRKRSWLYSRARLTVVTRLKVVRAIT